MKPQNQLVRCFTVPIERPKLDKVPQPKPADIEADTELARIINEAGAPWPGPYTVMDFETFTGAHSGQRARFGFFQDRGLRYDERVELAAQGMLTRELLDTCWREGIVYDPAHCKPNDIANMKAYAGRVNSQRKIEADKAYKDAYDKVCAELDELEGGGATSEDDLAYTERENDRIIRVEKENIRRREALDKLDKAYDARIEELKRDGVLTELPEHGVPFEYVDDDEINEIYADIWALENVWPDDLLEPEDQAESDVDHDAIARCQAEMAYLDEHNPFRAIPFVCFTIDEFIGQKGRGKPKVFYRPSYVKFADDTKEDRLIIGHNPAFDIGAISTHTGSSVGDMFGALSHQLCRCELNKKFPERVKKYEADIVAWKKAIAADIFPRPKKPKKPVLYNSCASHPNIRIKKLGHGKHMFKPTAIFGPGGVPIDPHLKFLDTMMLARALLGPIGLSLKNVGKVLEVKAKKTEWTDFNGPITDEYIDYCRNDVETTGGVWFKLRELYKQHGISKKIHDIYSEASIGKGYYRDFGVLPFLEKNPLQPPSADLMWDHAEGAFVQAKEGAPIPIHQFDPRITGAFMEAYYGGRSEARIRQMIVECMPADFRSQYPTVNANMKLQDLLLAERIEVDHDNPATREWLEKVTLDDLQKKETWPKLRGIARIKPDNDVLPFRTKYESHDAPETGIVGDEPTMSLNVGVNRIKDACPTEYTFADVIASKLLTGKCPDILETIELIPVGRQKTNAIELFGEKDAKIDLNGDDLFVKLIELRTEYKKRMKQGLRDREFDRSSSEYKRLDAIQNALKLLANATSYGILVEVIVDEHKASRSTMVYHGGGVTRVKARKKVIGDDGKDFVSGYKVEKPAKYFAPFGALIPAAGRLMLTIAERLAADNGLLYAFCDTDAMAFARPEGMGRETFRKKVQEIAGPKGWFQKLNPYKGDDPLFALEETNYALKDDEHGEVTDEFEPLYALVVSAKRYVLFNWGQDGKPILRKVSSHGLGDVTIPATYDHSKHDRTNAEHVAAPLDKDTGERNCGALAHSPSARFVCDMWRIAIEQFAAEPEGAAKRIDEIVATLPGLSEPQMTQLTLSSSHLVKIYDKVPNRRGFQFFMTFPAPEGLSNKFFRAEGVRPDERHDLMNSSLYAAVDKSRPIDEQIEEWKRTGKGIYRHDNGEFPHGLFNPAWGLRLQTIAERLKSPCSYFDRVEAKSRGTVGVLERKSVVSLDKDYIGKETNPLAAADTDMPDDETENEFAASQLIVAGQVLNLGAIEQHFEDASKASGVKIETLQRALKEGRGLSDKNKKDLLKVVHIDDDGEIEIRPQKISAKTAGQWPRVHAKLLKCGKFDAVAATMNQARKAGVSRGIGASEQAVDINDVIRFANLGDRRQYGEAPTLPLDRLETAIKLASGEQSAEERRASRRAEGSKYFKENADKNRHLKEMLAEQYTPDDGGDPIMHLPSVDPIGPLCDLEMLIGQEGKVSERLLGEWSKLASADAPHPTLFEVVDAVKAEEEAEAAAYKMKQNERQRKSRANKKYSKSIN